MSDDDEAPREDREERRASGGNGNSVEFRWGRRSLSMHGLIPIVALLMLASVVIVHLYQTWYPSVVPVTVSQREADRFSKEHEAIINEAHKDADAIIYVLMLNERQRADLRARMSVPKRFRDVAPGDSP